MQERDHDEEIELDDEELEEELDGDVTDRLRGATTFVAGLMLGALLGAGVALLIAPQRGEATRRRIGSRWRDIRNDAAEQLGDWKDDARRELRRRRKQLKRRLPTS